MGQLHIKPGVDFGPGLAPGGMRILEVAKSIVLSYSFDITITSARDGVHSGPLDPHHSGNALDFRSHDLQSAQKQLFLLDLQKSLYRDPRRFYAFLEAAGTDNEHFHCQVRSGTTYSMADYVQSL